MNVNPRNKPAMYVTTEIDDFVCTMTIDNPPVNALHPDVAESLLDAFNNLAAEHPDVRAVIITGAGKHFMAGGDINFFQTLDTVSSGQYARRIQIIQEVISHFPCPVIAAVNGTALGGGCELMMACDIRIASENAVFGQPEVQLGIIPGAGGTQNLPRLVPIGMAKRLLFTGDRISAAEALSIGLVDQVAPADQVMAEARALAGRIAKCAPLAVRAAKEAVNTGMELGLAGGLQHETVLFARLFHSSDVTEGVQAFLQKRSPKFLGR